MLAKRYLSAFLSLVILVSCITVSAFSVNAATKLAAPTSVKVADYYYYSGGVYLTWKQVQNASAYQVKAYNNNGKCVATEDGFNYTTDIAGTSLNNINKNQFYKIKVRAYIKDYNTGKITYGSWSKPIYACQGIDVKSKVLTKSSFKLSWAAVKGAKNYNVYMSTKKDGGYKKIKTTTSKKLTVKSFKGKKITTGKFYYFYVQANKKVSGKTIKSDTRRMYVYLYTY